MTGDKGSLNPDIDTVRLLFEQWRQTRQGKARIPDELWSAAAKVARRDGINRIAAALRLDGGKLKRRVLALDTVASTAAPPAFVELMTSGGSNQPEYTLEVEGRNGRLRIYCKGATATDLVGLTRAVWDVVAS
jgi:hypothetical protein